MRITIPKFATKEQLFAFLKTNKDALIAKKMEGINKSDTFIHAVRKNTAYKSSAKKSTIKASGTEQMGELKVTIVCNAAYFCDTQMDVLIPDCWKGTIKRNGPKGKNVIKHLKNHVWKTDDIVGKPTDIYSMEVPLVELGLNQVGNTQCLIMESIVKERFDCKTFDLYEEGDQNQHSIGMGYLDLELAINDPNDREYFAVWSKYYPSIINKDVVDEAGFFWAVPEIELYENSAVLWGSNELTPTLETTSIKDAQEECEEDEQEDEHEPDEEVEKATVETIKNFNFFCDTEGEDFSELVKKTDFFNN